MRITEVALEDIKSYADRTVVPIEGGVTAILGENGAGKSTIQEAIGFALFDSLPFNNKEFVREGASSGTVEITFEPRESGSVSLEGEEVGSVELFADSDGAATSTGTDGSVPGFGAPLAVLALLVTALAWGRRS